MDESEVVEQRYRFFAEKGAAMAFEQDKILVTLFTGIVAGLLALLVSKQMGFWSGLCFLVADFSAVLGLAVCLLHMAYSAKVLGILAAFFGGEEHVPSLIAKDESTIAALNRHRLLAQICYSGQLLCLFWAVLVAGLGVLALLWDVVGWVGFVVALALVLLLLASIVSPVLLLALRAKAAFQQQGAIEKPAG